MSEKLRSMLREYNEIQQSAKKLPVMRKQLVAQIKAEDLTKKKFKLSDKVTVSYHKYSRPADLSLSMVQDSLAEIYPKLDVKPVMVKINEKRNERRTTTETIQTKNTTSNPSKTNQ